MKKYIVLTMSALASEFLEQLDQFEVNINEFLYTEGTELVGGIAMTTIDDKIYCAQALLVEEKGSGEFGRLGEATFEGLAKWEGKTWKRIAERFPFERYGD